MAVRDDHGRTSVREVAEAEGGRVLRALDPDCPDRVLDVDVKVMIRGVVVMLGLKVRRADQGPVRGLRGLRCGARGNRRRERSMTKQFLF